VFGCLQLISEAHKVENLPQIKYSICTKHMIAALVTYRVAFAVNDGELNKS
jgi:hypothetical protein